MQQRQQEGRCFAGACLGKADQITPLQHGRNGLCLDRCRLDQPSRRSIIDNGRCQPQFKKWVAVKAVGIAAFGRVTGVGHKKNPLGASCLARPVSPFQGACFALAGGRHHPADGDRTEWRTKPAALRPLAHTSGGAQCIAHAARLVMRYSHIRW